MENTLLAKFCSVANLHGFVSNSELPEDLKPLVEAASKCFGDQVAQVDLNLGSLTSSKVTRALSDLDPEVRVALLTKDSVQNLHLQFGDSLQVGIASRISHKGLSFESFRTEGTSKFQNCHIFFVDLNCPDAASISVDGLNRALVKSVPARIEAIVKVPDATLLIIRRYIIKEEYHNEAQTSQTSIRNPFRAFDEFRLTYCSEQLATELAAINSEQIHCHAILRPWEPGVIILRPLDRVSIQNIACVCESHSRSL